MQVMKAAGLCAIALLIWVGSVEADGLVFSSDGDEPLKD